MQSRVPLKLELVTVIAAGTVPFMGTEVLKFYINRALTGSFGSVMVIV